MPGNKLYKNYEENDLLIVGKSDIDSGIYDDLVWASKKMKTVTIPPNIKRILPYAFSHSDIEKKFIPPSVTHICKGAF